MIRGTTPTLRFLVPYSASEIESGYITFAQMGKTRLEKTVTAEQITGDGEITLTLTQEDTLELTPDCICQIQLRLKLTSGRVAASHIISSYVDAILKEGVI